MENWEIEIKQENLSKALAIEIGIAKFADIEKGKKAQIGEIREWKSGKFRRTKDGWVPVNSEKGKFENDNSKKEESNTRQENLQNLSEIINQEKRKFKNKLESLGITNKHKFAVNFNKDISSFESKCKKLINIADKNLPILIKPIVDVDHNSYSFRGWVGINQYDAKKAYPDKYTELLNKPYSDHSIATDLILLMIGEKAGIDIGIGMSKKYGADQYLPISV